MEFKDLERLIKTRRSIRRWKEGTVPEEMILKALELAAWAPNGGNQQNWKFTVVTNKSLVNGIADAVQAKVNMMTDWPEAATFGEEVTRWRSNASFFRAAPVCIAVYMAAYDSIADKLLNLRVTKDKAAQPIIDARRSANSSLQSASAAMAYLLLALHAQGLGAIWLTGPLVAKAEIEKVLGAPTEQILVGLVAVGYPDEQPEKTRKPLTEVVEFLR